MTDDNLTDNQRTLISCVGRLNTPSTSDLKDDDEASDIYSSHSSLHNALEGLADDNYLDCIRGNPNTWSLAEKGKRVLDAIKRQRRRIQEDDITDFEPAEEFASFFQNAATDELARAEANESFLRLDLDELGRFNSELEQKVLKEPVEMIDYCQDALVTYCGFENEIEVRVQNIPDVYRKTISDLSSYDMGQLVSVSGVIQSVTAPKLEAVWAEFECMQCGNMQAKTQEGAKIKSPYKCSSCENKQFRKVNVEYETVRFLHVKEQPGQKMRNKIVVVVRGDLAIDERHNLQAAGCGITVTGHLEPYKARKGADAFDTRLVANNVEIEDSKWENIEIDADDRERIEELGADPQIRDKIKRSLGAKSVKNVHLLKEAVAVWLLGKTSEGNIHLMAFGDPGTGKSELGEYLKEHFPRVLWSVATGASGVGLTASVSKDKLTGDWVAEAGALAMADEGFHITDEVDKLSDDEDISNMNEALSSGSISLDKASIHTEISADVSEMVIGNPTQSRIDRTQAAYTQIPIDDSKSDLKDRFDIFVCLKGNQMETEEQEEEEREIVRHMVRRGQDIEDEEPEIPISEELLIKYFAYAQRLNPQLTEEAAQKLEEVYFTIKKSEDDSSLWGRRRLMTLKKVSMAFARMHLSEQVTVTHVQEANNFIRRAFASMDFEIGKDNAQALSRSERDKRETVKNKIAELQAQEDEDAAYIEDVIQAVDLSEEVTEDVLNVLTKEGEAFEPKSGWIRLV